MRAAPIILAGLSLILAGCSREEEPVANRFERQKAEIESKANALESQVENEVGAAEARLQNEVAVTRQNQVANAADANAAAPANSSR